MGHVARESTLLTYYNTSPNVQAQKSGPARQSSLQVFGWKTDVPFGSGEILALKSLTSFSAVITRPALRKKKAFQI